MLHIFANLFNALHRLAITTNNNCSITLNLGLEKIKIQLIYMNTSQIISLWGVQLYSYIAFLK